MKTRRASLSLSRRHRGSSAVERLVAGSEAWRGGRAALIALKRRRLRAARCRPVSASRLVRVMMARERQRGEWREIAGRKSAAAAARDINLAAMPEITR